MKSVLNVDYQYRGVKIQAFINYLKDPWMKMNFGKLCVTDDNITILGELHTVSVKTLFTTLINKEEWNSHQWQESSEVLAYILNCLMEKGMDGPFKFSKFTTDLRLTCSRCHIIYNFGARM